MTSPDRVTALRQELMRRLMAEAGLTSDPGPAPIGPRDRTIRTPLSSVQNSLWLHQRTHPASTSYNGCLVVRVSGPLDVPALRTAAGRLVRTHEILRTTYRVDDDGIPYQVVSDTPVPDLPVRDLAGTPPELRDAEAEHRAVRLASTPFDLARERPVRFELVRFADDDHALVQVVHHIAWDGGTWGVLSRDLARFYAQSPGGQEEFDTPAPRVQYADFAAAEAANTAASHATGAGHDAPDDDGVAFWRERLSPPPVVPDLPASGPRSAPGDERGGRRVRRFDPEIAKRLEVFAAEAGVTAFTVALTAFTALLHRYTGTGDIPVGTLVMDRADPDAARLVGNFGNTVVLRADLSSDDGAPLTFRQATSRLRDVCADAFAHQDVPFDRVLDAVRPARRPGRPPLFDVMFGMLTQELGELELPGLTTSWRHIHNGTTQFDLALEGFLRDGSLVVEATHREPLFDAAHVDRLLGHLETLLAAALAAPDTPLTLLDLLPAHESPDHEPVAEPGPFPMHGVASLVDDAIAAAPDVPAVVFGDTTWTHAELDARADAFAAGIARELEAAGAPSDPVVALALPRSADLVAVLLAVLRNGAAYLPLDPGHPRERVAAMLADAAPDLLVCDATWTPPEGAPRVCGLDELAAHGATHTRPGSHPHSAAYVVFTSGSTGRPKAVIGTQRALTERLRWGRDTCPGTGADRTGAATRAEPGSRVRVAKSALAFIDGTTELLGALVAGDTIVIADDETARDPLALTALADRHGAGTLTVVPSLLATLVDTAPPGSLDTVHTWISSGEALPFALADAVAARWPRARLVNLYGCSEAAGDSLAATHAPGAHPARGTGVPIGRPITGTGARVLDAALRPVPIGVPGELYLTGGGLARGYLGRPGATAERFVADPYGPPGTRMYRTGDLARRRADGVLEFAGRADHQVKIRGSRVEPGEIEAVLLGRADIARAAVVPVRDASALCAYVVPTSGARFDVEALRADLARVLPAAFVPDFVTVLTALPLNPNGKLDRSALPAPTRASGTRRAPTDERERALHAVFAEFLDVPPAELGVDDDFFTMGGHSLLAARLANRIRSAFAVEVSVADVFRAPTVSALARELADAEPVRPRVRDTDAPDRAAASFAQTGLWFEEQVRGPSAAYNLPLGLRLRGSVDPETMRAALRDVVARHPGLRTLLVAGPDGVPVQDVLAPGAAGAAPRCDVVSAHEWSASRLAAEIAALVARPFALDTDLPVRAGLFTGSGSDESTLVLVLHHSAADRWSFGPLLRDLSAAYTARAAGRAVPQVRPAVTHAMYATWQRDLLGDREAPSAHATRRLAYWEGVLRDAPEELLLPAHRSRPAERDHLGGTVEYTLPAGITDALRALAAEHGASVFMALHAAVVALLHRLGAGDDVLLGAPVAGRADEDLDDVIGFFVNTVVLRTGVTGEVTFAELLDRVRRDDLAAFANADVPFDWVVDRVGPTRSLSRHPLIQATIAHHRADEVALTLPGVRAEPFAPPTGAAMFDLDLRFVETASDGVHVHASYARDMFDADTVRALLERLHRLLGRVLTDPTAPLGTVGVLTDAEHDLLAALDQGVHAVPDTLVVRRIADRVRLHPHTPALVDADGAVTTYAELAAGAARLARLLIDRGAGPGRIVAVAVPRSPELVAAQLAVLASGSAYLPLDPDHPDARITDTLADARPALVLTTPELAERPWGVDVVRTDAIGSDRDTAPDLDSLAPPAPARPAYVMYTSGSTGRPKGVVVSHAALAHQLAWVQNEYALTPTDRVLHKSPVGFDVSLWEVLWPLCAGAAVVLAEPGGHRDPGHLADLLKRHAITVAHFVPPVLDAVLDVLDAPGPPALPGGSPVDRANRARPLPSLRVLLCGGEALPPATAERARRVVGFAPHNTYGPTEATITATAWDTEHDGFGDVVPIGRPVWNTNAHVLDAHLAPTPIGLVGELYLTGPQLAEGYLRGPGHTAERFVADPYGAPGTRMYRTGDLVRRRADGATEYIGRTDHQVKVRGVRIELGEIETYLALRPDVSAAVVVARPGANGVPGLVAYAVPAPGVALDPDTVRAELAERLPEHLVPAVVVALDALPLTPTGKLDRAALPRPRTGAERPAGLVAPRDAVEAELAAVFADVLRVDRVSVEDGFFALGGDSIGATLVATRARRRGLRFTVKDVFRHPSVAALAKVAAREAVAAAVPPPAVEAPEPPLLHVLRDAGTGPNGHHVAAVRAVSPDRAGDLVAALAELVRVHPALRLRVSTVGKRLWRTSVTDSVSAVPLRVVSDPGSPDVGAEYRRMVDALDITTGPTLAVTRFPDRLLVVAHALALDAVSVARVADALAGTPRERADRVTPAAADDAVDLWVQTLRDAEPARPCDESPEGVALFLAVTVAVAAGDTDPRAVALRAFVEASRERCPLAGTHMVDRLVDPPRGDALGSFAYVYPFAFPARGPVPDLAAWDARGAGYGRARYGSRAGARELGRVPRAHVVLRDAAPTGGTVDVDVPGAESPRWTIDAAVADAPTTGTDRVVRLTLRTGPTVHPNDARALFARWTAETLAHAGAGARQSTAITETRTTTAITSTGRTT